MAYNPNDYEPVDTRLHRFWEDIRASKLTATIETELLEVVRDEQGKPLQYVVRTTIAISDGRRASGLAEELVGSSPVNRTSALENAETSSTGRALAQLGYSPKGARPSAEEMQKVAAAQPAAAPKTNGKAAPKPAPAAAPAPAPAPVAVDDNKATPDQWHRLVVKFGSKNAVLLAARRLYEGAITSALDVTYLQAERLLEEGSK